MSSFLAAVLFFIYSLGARAETRQRYLFYLGGGESVSRDAFKTNFDTSFQFILRIENLGWKGQFLFGGDQETARKFRREASGKVKALTEANLRDFLKGMLQDMRSGKLDGSQVLLYLDTHGILERKTYYVGTADSKVAIFPYIEEMKSLSQSHGIQFAVIGATCFSGQLFKLADERTCVLSTAPSDTVGLMMTNNTTSFLLGNGSAKNLEDLHLQSRMAKDVEFGQPLISTHAGQRVFSLLKNLRTTLLLAGKKAANEIEIADEKGVMKTIGALQNFMKDQQENPTIPAESLAQLSALDFKLQSILTQHRTSIVSLLTSSCESPNHLGEVCLFAENQATDSRLPTDPENNSVMKERRNSQRKQHENPPYQILDDLVHTASKIGQLERSLYMKLYEKFKAEQASPSACEQFALK